MGKGIADDSSATSSEDIKLPRPFAFFEFMVSQKKTERNIEKHRQKSFLIYRHFVYFVV